MDLLQSPALRSSSVPPAPSPVRWCCWLTVAVMIGVMEAFLHLTDGLVDQARSVGVVVLFDGKRRLGWWMEMCSF